MPFSIDFTFNENKETLLKNRIKGVAWHLYPMLHMKIMNLGFCSRYFDGFVVE